MREAFRAFREGWESEPFITGHADALHRAGRGVIWTVSRVRERIALTAAPWLISQSLGGEAPR